MTPDAEWGFGEFREVEGSLGVPDHLDDDCGVWERENELVLDEGDGFVEVHLLLL